MKLIVGLGNPGSQYERTRHNAGFMAVDAFARRHGAGNFRVAHESFLADVLLKGEKILLLKPQTYMNLSGRAVASAMGYYKLGLGDLLVVVDDVALPTGVLRLRSSGSAGGHNGLKDIEGALSGTAGAGAADGCGKTGREYQRLRIGVDAPGRVPQKSYVLETFSADQRPKMEAAFEMAAEAMEVWATLGITAAMNRFNAGEKG